MINAGRASFVPASGSNTKYENIADGKSSFFLAKEY